MQDKKENDKPVQMGGQRHRGMFLTDKPKDRKKTFKRLLSYLEKQKLRLIAVCFMAALSAFTYISAIGISGSIIDKYISTSDIEGLKKGCLLMLIVYLSSTGVDYIMNRLMVGVAQKTTASIRDELFKKVSRLHLSFIEKTSSGDLMSRMTNDIDNINNVLSQSTTQMFYGVFGISMTVIAMLMKSVILTAIALITVPLMMIITKTIAKQSRKYYKKQQAILGKLNGYTEEIISAEKLVKLNNREEDVKEEFQKMNLQLRKAGIVAQSLSGLGPIMNMINNLSYLIVSVAGAYMVINNMGVSVGVMFSFLLYMRQISRPLNELANLFNTVQSALAGAERVFDILDEESEYENQGNKELKNPKGHIVFSHVNFSYEKDKPILKDINIEAKPGQQIAIVGQTGAGKTTIISLLNRFYDVDSGEITIDGENIKEFTKDSLRKNTGMVLQDTYLFSESIWQNLRYGKEEATEEEVIAAAKMARADSFIKHLKDGYDTVLQDNGQDLSQGQRQLLSIARVILSDPAILILDEATSSIDTATELHISEALKELMKGRTSFIIAHRLSTIKNADIILVMEKGEIIEQGNHKELMQQNKVYANLVKSQYNIEN